MQIFLSSPIHGHLKQIPKRLSDFFSMADAVAQQTKLVQRKSRFSGAIFFKSIIFGFLNNPTASLNSLAQQSLSLGVKISPQGVHDRINHYAVDFMKAMFLHGFDQFKNKLALPLPILQQFSAIYLVDSTFKQLPASMTAQFPGTGGKASSAGLKVQLVFEFLQGNFAQFAIESGRMADQAYTKYLDIVEAGSLVIADLGYFRLDSLKAIVEKKAFFLSRYHYTTALFWSGGEKLDIFAYLRSKRCQSQDLWVEMGASLKQRIACRLIAVSVPPTVVEERRRKARRRAKVMKKTYTDDYMASLAWSVFVTNIPDTLLSAEQVVLFYRIRWQIELIFKFWKSFCGLESIPALRQERVLTEFYAKLLIALIANYLIAPLRIPDEVWSNREISPYQIRALLSLFAHHFMHAISSPRRLHRLLDLFFRNVDYFAYKQKRSARPNILSLLASLP